MQVSEYPGYLEIIGGEDRLMDLGTMQVKVTSGEYRSMDDMEVSPGKDKLTNAGRFQHDD